MINIAIAIPARLKSSRLKEKMLLRFDGKPLIQNVFEKVSRFGYDTFVLTDSEKIAQHIPNKNVILTGEEENGAARICSQKMKFADYDYIINVQGDMLDITYETIEPIIKTIGDHKNVITGYTKGYTTNGVKIIHQGKFACWFTRKDIGYGDSHLGIYAYPSIFLNKYSSLTENYPSESLEQNRILGSNFRIMAVEVKYDGREINTKEDL
jgi:3-deoxy-manno-octulosonate cytidylyltransferase (CMP-KDO synthetase)|tara:strand:- start:481 stop:1110 length:630 start_codon:yes stop_codon:yes gene_type:complete